ncbi:MAG: ankyrin repeat domain-containing protein [Candidatus Eremiobacteraeota bacterium]|nr:ankyrin repeat domain-containing protein [Candidatus Eremiobacteraeota bacterium]
MQPEPKGGYAINGVYPGLFRCEIKKKLGEPVLADPSFEIYPDGRGATINVYYHFRNLCYRVEGKSLELEGSHLSKPPLDYDSSQIRVFFDSSGRALCYRLDAEEIGQGDYLPVPGASLLMVDYFQAIHYSDTAAALKMLELHPRLRQARILSSGETPLHLAVRYNRRQIVARLLELGVDVNIRDFNGKTPLATAHGEETIQLLLDAGAER